MYRFDSAESASKLQTVLVADGSSTGFHASDVEVAIYDRILGWCAVAVLPFALALVIDIVADPSEPVEVEAHEETLLDAIDPLADQLLVAVLLDEVAFAMRLAILKTTSVDAAVLVLWVKPLDRFI